MEMKLSKNFTLDEMCRSSVARRLHLKNTPSPKEVANLKVLCEKVLQPLRDYLGAPVIINSGYRSPELNRVIAGAHGSQHVKGEAADIRCVNRKYAEHIVSIILMNLEFDQLILEKKKGAIWVHVSYSTKGKNRQTFLRTLM